MMAPAAGVEQRFVGTGEYDLKVTVPAAKVNRLEAIRLFIFEKLRLNDLGEWLSGRINTWCSNDRVMSLTAKLSVVPNAIGRLGEKLQPVGDRINLCAKGLGSCFSRASSSLSSFSFCGCSRAQQEI